MKNKNSLKIFLLITALGLNTAHADTPSHYDVLKEKYKNETDS